MKKKLFNNFAFILTSTKKKLDLLTYLCNYLHGNKLLFHRFHDIPDSGAHMKL